MRSPNFTLVHETASICFNRVLSMLGEGTPQLVYTFLSKRGIGKGDISTRFEDVEKALAQLFGQAAKSILVATLAKFCEEYSVPLNLEYADSLSLRLRQLEEQMLVERRLPKHFTTRLDTTNFEDKIGALAPWAD